MVTFHWWREKEGVSRLCWCTSLFFLIHTHLYACIHTHLCAYPNTCTCLHTCTFVCVHACARKHWSTHISFLVTWKHSSVALSVSPHRHDSYIVPSIFGPCTKSHTDLSGASFLLWLQPWSSPCIISPILTHASLHMRLDPMKFNAYFSVFVHTSLQQLSSTCQWAGPRPWPDCNSKLGWLWSYHFWK